MHSSETRTAFWREFWLTAVVLGGLPAQAVGALPTTITLSGSPNPATFGQPVILTAIVTPATATGNVTFYDGVTALGIRTLASGKATLTTTLLPSGQRYLKAFYSGDAADTPATSSVRGETVNALSAVGFGPPKQYALPGANDGYATDIAVADFNGDGNADLVTISEPAADATPVGVSVFLGNGDGTFQSKLTYYFPSSNFDYAANIVVADFNGDGKTDVAAAYGGKVSVLLINSLVTFQTYTFGQPVYRIAAADFDGDGRVDLAVETSGGLNLVFGNGDGTFRVGPVYPTDPGDLIAVGDFNGDGLADVAVVNDLSGTVGILLGTGRGTLEPAIDSVTGITRSESIVVEDFNGDGKSDLVIGGAGKIVVLLGNGGGTFQASASYIPNLTTYLRLGVSDLNGDGKSDLAVSMSGYLVVLLGNGDGTFLAPTILGTSNSSLNSLGGVAIGDFNGDGRPDLALASQYILIGGAGVATSTTISSSANPSSLGESVVLTAAVSPADAAGSFTFYDGASPIGTVPLSGGTAAFVTSKLAAGSRSLTVSYSGDTYHGPSTSPPLIQTVILAAATTTALSASATQILYGQSIRLTAMLSPSTADGSVAFFDGSILIATQTLIAGQAVFTANTLAAGTHSFHAFYGGNDRYTPSNSTTITIIVNAVLANGAPSASTFPVGGTGVAMIEGDFNADGKTDFAVASNGSVSVLLGNGDGTFRSPLVSPTGINPEGSSSLSWGDFNGDGKTDLMVTGGGQVAVFPGNGDGTFQTGANYAVANGANQVVVGDFNGDGKADFAINSGGIVIFLGMGDGTFHPGTISVDPSASSFAVADFNGDGIPDFVTNGVNGVTVILSHGDGTFTAFPSFDAPSTVYRDYAYRTSVSNLAVGDFNGDGKPDLAIQIDTFTSGLGLRSTYVSILPGRGDGTFEPSIGVGGSSVLGNCCADTLSFRTGDLNGDGISDIVVSYGSFLFRTTILTVLLGRADGTFDSKSYTSSSVPPGNFLVGEFNGDGIPDLAALSGSSVRVNMGRVLALTAVQISSTPNPSFYGQNVTLTAVISPATAAGSVTFMNYLSTNVGTAPVKNGLATLIVNSLRVGTNSLTATYTGDATFFPGTSTGITQTVSIAAPSISLSSSANPATFGQNVLLTAIASDPLATGSVTFKDGDVALGSSSMSQGVARLLVSTLSVASHPLSASYGGDSNNQAAESPLFTQTINLGLPPAITLSSSASPVIDGQNVTLSATALGTGYVTFYDGTTVLGTRALAEGQANLTTNELASGKRRLRAYYAGDDTYAPGFSPLLAQTVSALPSQGFQMPMNYTSNSNGLSVTCLVAGDFNGDGNIDIVTCDSAGVREFLGNGDGTFQAPVTLNALNAPQYAVVGDFNGDGKTDLAIGGTVGQVGVLLGNGDGSFQAPQYNFSTPGLFAGDLNGDGRTDLLTGSGNYGGAGTVGVLLGFGDGSFQPQMIIRSNRDASVVLLGDYNGDGVADVVVSTVCGHTVGILLGNGDGTFSTEVDYETSGVVPSSCEYLAYPGSVASADFNGDGVADLAVVNLDGSASVLLGDGDGTFQSAVRYALGPGPGSPTTQSGIAVGDFNGDGNTDLVVAGSQGVAVLSGNGDGTFQRAVSYYSGASSLILVADFNEDGRDDLAILDGVTGFTVLLGAAPELTSSKESTTSAPRVRR